MYHPVLGAAQPRSIPRHVLQQETASSGVKCTEDVLVKVERREHQDPAPRFDVTILFVASMPSMRGMRMSMSTTSGRSCRARSTASQPSPASPTTVNSPVDSRISRNPVPQDPLVVGQEHLDGHRASPPTGMSALTRQAPRASGPTLRSPPRSAIRSFMTAKPFPPGRSN